MKNVMIKSTRDITVGVNKLIRKEPKFIKALAVCEYPKPRTVKTGFEALFRIIVGQQLSIAAAEAIWKKIIARRLTKAKSILLASEETLCDLGLSKTKVSYIKGDISKIRDLKKMQKNFDYVVNFGGYVNHRNKKVSF